jgi:hypothetical protein
MFGRAGQITLAKNQMPETLEPLIPDAEDWAPVQLLIRDVQEAEMGKSYAASIVFWNTAVRLFRRAERILLFEQRPSPEDLKIHEALLHALLGVGQLLELRIHYISDEDLSPFGIRRETLSAYNRELKNVFWIWHGREAETAQAAFEQAILAGQKIPPFGQPIPSSFEEGLRDIEEGRVVDLDIALTQPPPSA